MRMDRIEVRAQAMFRGGLLIFIATMAVMSLDNPWATAILALSFVVVLAVSLYEWRRNRQR